MIYIKTELGRKALKERSDLMPRKYHFPFLMCDGSRDHLDILTAEARTGFTQDDMEQMVLLGFIEPVRARAAEVVAEPVVVPIAPVGVTTASAAIPSRQQADVFLEACQIATALSSKLGLRGFRLNLAVQAAGNLNDFDSLLPQLEKALGFEAVKPLAILLRSVSR